MQLRVSTLEKLKRWRHERSGKGKKCANYLKEVVKDLGSIWSTMSWEPVKAKKIKEKCSHNNMKGYFISLTRHMNILLLGKNHPNSIN